MVSIKQSHCYFATSLNLITHPSLTFTNQTGLSERCKQKTINEFTPVISITFVSNTLITLNQIFYLDQLVDYKAQSNVELLLNSMNTLTSTHSIKRGYRLNHHTIDKVQPSFSVLPLLEHQCQFNLNFCSIPKKSQFQLSYTRTKPIVYAKY